MPTVLLASTLGAQGGSDSLTSLFEENLVAFAVGSIGATLLLLMPGYILAAVFNRGLRTSPLDNHAFVAATGIGGVSVHAAFLWWTVSLGRRIAASGLAGNVWEIVGWIAIVLYIAPVAVGLGLGYIAERREPSWLRGFLTRLGISDQARTRTAWQYKVGKFPAFVRVRLRGGDAGESRVIWGKLGMRSAASSDSEAKDLYLQTLYETDADEWIGQERSGSRGVWISSDAIESIEFYGREEHNG